MEQHKKNIAILGSTGSIGTQALEIIEANPDQFIVEVLTAGNNADLLIEQARKFNPNTVVIGNELLYDKVASALDPLNIKVFSGDASIAAVAGMEQLDMVLVALVGYAGVMPTLKAIESGNHIALANKETLVVAGDLVTVKAREKGVNIYPVDSEHSAIFQCLTGEFHNPIRKVILTASGGPFRGKTKKDLEKVTKKEALKHPNWDMGAKVTIDSASLMNKGLEVIEAKWLFSLKPEQIEVVVHPQSIIHSMIQFEDTSIKAQLGLPDMRIPIQYALSYPERLAADFPDFSFLDYPELNFQPPDVETFRNLNLAYDAMKKGGNMPCILNAANEIAVEAFLNDQIGFLEMSEVIETCMVQISFCKSPHLDDYINTDKETRIKAKEIIK